MFRRNSLMTRIISAVLSVGMVWSMSPTSVLAENAVSQNASAARTESTQMQEDTTKSQEKTPATIVLDANGGTGTMEDVQIADSSDFEQKLSANVYKRDGYLFMGWSTTANNKDAKNAAGRVVTPAIAVPDAADIANWKFLWDANGDGTADPGTETFDLSSCVKDGTLTLYAQWARITTTVHFDGNGATSGTMEDEVMPQDTDTALSPNAFARDGYKLTGWSTTNDNQSIKDDPATAADESFLATFLGDQAHFLKNVASYDSDGDGAAESFDMNYAAAADSKNAANSTITLYAQWEKLPEQSASENADANQNKSTETAEDSEQKTDESQSASADQVAASDTGSDSAADNQNAEAVATDSSDSKEESGADESADSSDESGLVAESDEDHLKNAAPAESTADNAQADVRDADRGGADNLSVKVQDTSAATSFAQSLSMLFAAPAKESAAAPADNPSQDGESIKELSVKWETPGKVSADDSALTIFTPSDNSKQTAKASVYISLDSNKSYKAGSVRLVIPGHIFKKRDGSKTGNLVLPLVENPGTKTEFNWAYDAENDVYTLTSTRDISGRSEIKIEMGFENLTPSTLVDMQASSDFVAKAYVMNSKGNLLTKTSNTIKATFDTQETLKTAEIKPNGQIPWETKVPASQIPEDKRIAGVDQYLVVTYYTYAYHTGNTAYTLGWDTANEDFGAYDDANGAKVADGVVIDGGSGIDTQNGWSWDGNTGWHYVKVAYDFSKFSADTDYTLKAGAKWTLTETDNAGQIHVLPATTSVKFAWHNPVPVPPGGHYAHMNWGDDNNDSFMMHLSINGYQYDYSNRTFSHSELLRGYYGIYRTALNDLAEGSDATVRYEKYLRGYMLPDQLVQGGDNTKKASFSNPVRMVLEDGDYSIAENAGDPQYQGLTAGTDYDIASVFVCKPTHVYKATEVDASNLQSKDFLYETGTSEPYYYSPGSKVQGGTYGVAYEKTDDLDYYPKSVVEAEVNGQWQTVDTVDWKTAASDKVEVKLPAGTQRWRVTVASDSIAKEGEQAAAVDTQFVCPTVVLHPTDKVKTLAANAISDMTTPECLFLSMDSFNAYNKAGASVYHFDGDGNDHLFGYNSNIMAMPSAPKNPSDHSKDGWDNGNTKYSVTFSGKVQEQSSVLDKDTWEEAAKAGKIQTEKSGTWYDLLPKGAVADLSTIQLRDGDQVTDAYTIENYKGSGRTLLVVKAQLAAEPVYQDRDGVKYVEDDPSITFKATYSMSSYLDYGQNLHNVVVFESGNETLGNVEHYIGQPDDPTKASADDVTVTKDITDGEKDILKDLDPSTDKAAFTYAGESVNIGAYTITHYGFDKQVDVNNEYDYGYGTTDGEKDAYLGGFYSYRLSYIAKEGNYQGLVMYDRLEDPRDGVMPSGASSWKGTLLSVDTSMLKSMGIEPVVYYSTTPNLQLATMEGGADTGTAAAQADLTYTSIWSATAPSDLSSVTAIAIDCSHKTDGSAFILDAGQTIAATIAMRAPSDASKESSRAYNDAYFSSQTENAGHVEDAAMTYKGHTEVALKPFKLHVTNTWNDDNDRDGLRPTGKVVLHLYANGEPAQDANGKEISFTIDPAAASDGYAMSQDADEIIDSLPIADASGNAIHYTATLTNEDGSAIDGYTQSVKYGKDTDGNAELALTQNHTPATTSISGTKTWSGDTEDIRPSAISINLLADGQQSQTRQITENAAGEWIYSFQNLPKYENHGKEIAYSVSETGAEDYAVTATGYDLQNVYHPYGDLTVSKTVTNGTAQTANQKFTFHLNLTKQDGSDYTDAVTYKKSDGTTGTITSGRTFELGAGESIVLKELPKGTSWKVTEDAVSGYTADASEKSGTIKPNAVNMAAFTNNYETSADVSLQASKTLDGRPIQYGQFTFELRDESGNLVRTASNDEKGAVSFGALHYTNADSGKTFIYTIRETDLKRPGYKYDSAQYKAVVKPVDNGDGTMTANSTVKYYKMEGGKQGEEVAKPTFANTYTATGSVTLTAYKQLKGRDLKDREFTFDLHAVDVSAGTDTVIVTAQNVASGRIDFKADDVVTYMNDHNVTGAHGLSYTQYDIYEKDADGTWSAKDAKDTTFVYYVTEESGADDTVTYSDQKFAWTVALQDDGDDKISAATKNVDATGLINDDGTVNKDWTPTKTTSLPTFVNTLKNGWLSIEKDAENAPAGDQTPFTFDVDIKDSDGRPLNTDSGNVTYEIDKADSNSSASTSTSSSSDSSSSSTNGSAASESSTSSDPVSTTLNSLASLLQPTSAYAADTDNADKSWTITYDANGGKFADGSTQNKVTYTGHKATTTKYSHTDNIDDNGVARGVYAANLSKTDTVTIPGAKHLTIDVWYSTESTSYDWLAIYPAGVTPSSSNYAQASVSGGKLGDGRATSKDGATHKQFTVDGDTAQFYFRSDSSGQYYGYYAVVTDANTVVYYGTYQDPDSVVFKGWYADPACTKAVTYPANEGADTTVYAKWSRYTDEGTWGTCHWGILPDETMEINEGIAGAAGDAPWRYSNYVNKVKSIKATGKVTLPKECGSLFYRCSSLASLDLSSFDTSNVRYMDSMFKGCYLLSLLRLGIKFVPMDGTGLPEPPTNDTYNGKWVCLEYPSIIISSADLMKEYPSDNAPVGTYEWQRKQPIVISFNANGGAGSMAAYQSYSVNVVLPECGFYNAEHDFTGWNTQADGKGTSYQPGDIYDTQGTNSTLYAQWKKSDNTAKVTNGHFTVTIKAGQKITIKGLPGGATYTVQEHNRAGWVLKSSTGATGKIPACGVAASVFTNTYDQKATSVDISATKTLDGKAPKDGAYSFTMTANTVGAPMPDGVTGTTATATNAGILVDFGHIVFTKPGTYIYTLAETAGTDSTISYDSHTIKARVDVSDPTGTGALVARVSYSPDDTFANTTKPGTLTVTKTVTGTSDTSKDFTFSVSLMDAKSNPLTGTYGGVSVTDGKGTFTLKAGESKQLDNLPAGTQYQVEETNIPDGYTSSSTNASGTIAAAGSATAAFTNTYAASATSAYLTATKSLTGRQLKDREFTFELKDASGKQVQTATNDADGNIAFEGISFTAAGEYKYYVDEVKPENADETISYSDDVYEYDIQVTDNGAGELQNAVSTYAVDPATHERKGDKVDTASFTNAVKTGSVSLTKTVEGSKAVDKTFTFDVSLKDSAGKALDGEYTWTSSRKGTGGKAITGTVKNGGKLDLQKDETVTITGLPAGSTYEFTEEDAAGYTQSASSNLNGTIVADQTIAASATNTYAATGVAQIRARKVVLRSGQETTPAANAFRFSLTEKSGEKSSMYDKPVAVTTTNDGNGNVAFMKLVYTADDAGKTFEYTIAEVVDGQGDAYDFDSNSYLAEVTVMDNHDGTLDCQVKYSTDDGKTWTDDVPVFRNNTVTKMPLSGAAGFDGLIAAGGAVLVISALAWIRRRRRNGEA